MQNRPVLLASDIHLGAAPPEHERAFLEWLATAPDRASAVVLNGDLFDFWFEYLWGTSRGHDRALRVLRDIVASGFPVTLLGGNHDWWGGRYLREEIGVEFLQEPMVRDLAGHRAFVGHGDALGPGDVGYHFLKWVLRSRVTRLLFSLLPPPVGDAVAGAVSSTHERWKGPTAGDRERADILSDWAAVELHRRPDLDLLVLGHTHVPQLRAVGEGKWYVNLGDWVHHRTYLELRRGEAPRLVDAREP